MSGQNNTELLGTEPVGRLLVRYALPAIIAMSSMSLYNIIDSIFIGHGVGALAISGLAITMPLMNLAAAFASLVGVGASSLTSIRLGQGNKERAFLILSNTLMLSVIFGVVLSIAGLVFLDPILYFFEASDDTIGYSREFMQVILGGGVVTQVFICLNEILRASGYPRKAMMIMLATVVVNLCLNPLFIFGFGWGIRGSALATVISQCVAVVLELIHFLDRRNFLYFRRRSFRMMGVIVRKVLSIGLAPFTLSVCACVVVIFINKALMHTGGDLSIGAFGIMNRVNMLFVMIVAGFNQGMQPIVGYNYGARQFGRVVRALKITTCCGVAIMALGFILGRFLPHLVAGIFADDATLIDITVRGFKIVVMAFPLAGFQIVASSFFQYIGKPQKAIVLFMTRQLLFLIPLLAILPGIYGTAGVWMSMPIADTLAAVLAGVLLFFQIRKLRRHPDTIKVI